MPETLDHPGAPRAPWAAERIAGSLRGPRRVLVALSGGVDSSVVAALAHAAVGEGAIAATLTGPAVSASEIERAERVARHLGIVHARVPIDPLASPEYRANPPNRCYFCRRVETAALRAWGLARGFARFLDGVQRDDLAEARPGLRAMDEAGFEHPLARAGWGKAEVRAYARAVGLPNADHPSDACLASRVRVGQPITAALLSRVEAGEEAVRGLGFQRVRVRVEGRGARVEVDPFDVPRLLSEPVASAVSGALSSLGFAPVVLDPAGYRARRNR